MEDVAGRTARPSDFSYKHDAKRTSTLVIAEIFEPPTSEQIMISLTHLLQNSAICKSNTANTLLLTDECNHSPRVHAKPPASACALSSPKTWVSGGAFTPAPGRPRTSAG